MTAIAELRAGLVSIARRSLQIRPACKNEESAKLYLVLPVLGQLGYDYTNPLEVYPEHPDGSSDCVDFAILRDGEPVIAIEVRKVGANLANEQGQLRRYFDQHASVKLGILTDGIRFDLFVDSNLPDVMDATPFLTLDLDLVSKDGVDHDVLDFLVHATKKGFAPETIAEAVHVDLVKKRLRALLIEELGAPSEPFCRFLLERIGVSNARRESIEFNYGPLTKAALDEAIILPLVAQLRAHPTMPDGSSVLNSLPFTPKLASVDRELAVFAYVRRRLAYLVEDQHHFEAIENIGYKMYLGRIAIFYKSEVEGKLFDFSQNADGQAKFTFDQPHGAIVTHDWQAIDEPLATLFSQRVRYYGGADSGFVKAMAG